MSEEELIRLAEQIFEECLAEARHPVDGSLLGQDKVLASMRIAIAKAYQQGRADALKELTQGEREYGKSKCKQPNCPYRQKSAE